MNTEEGKSIQEVAGDLIRLANISHPDKEIYEVRVRKIKGDPNNPVVFEIIDSEYKNIDKGC